MGDTAKANVRGFMMLGRLGGIVYGVGRTGERNVRRRREMWAEMRIGTDVCYI